MATRLVIGATQSVSVTFYSGETVVDADVPDTGVTYSITHVNGWVMTPAGTIATHAGTGTGTYSASVPAQLTPADLIITYTGVFGGSTRTVSEYVKIVGGFFADLSEIRALDGLSNTTTYTTANLIEKREIAEALLEHATGRHWTRKYAREVLDGDQKYRRGLMVTDNFYFIQLSRRLGLINVHPRTVLFVGFDDTSGRIVTDGVTTNNSAVITSATANFSLSTDLNMLVTGPGIPQYATIISVQSPTQATLSANATITATGVTLNLGGGEYSNGIIAQTDVPLGYKLYPGGEIERLLSSGGWPRGVENVVIEYIYGEDAPPYDMKRAFLQLVRHMLLQDTSRIPDNARSMTTPDGVFELGLATGWQKPTGLPYVDSVIERYGEIQQVIA